MVPPLIRLILFRGRRSFPIEEPDEEARLQRLLRPARRAVRPRPGACAPLATQADRRRDRVRPAAPHHDLRAPSARRARGDPAARGRARLGVPARRARGRSRARSSRSSRAQIGVAAGSGADDARRSRTSASGGRSRTAAKGAAKSSGAMPAFPRAARLPRLPSRRPLAAAARIDAVVAVEEPESTWLRLRYDATVASPPVTGSGTGPTRSAAPAAPSSCRRPARSRPLTSAEARRERARPVSSRRAISSRRSTGSSSPAAARSACAAATA